MTEMTTRAFADAIGTDPKTLRKFLRASTPRDQHPGKGGRWSLPADKRSIARARKDFLTWQAEEAKRAADRAKEAASAAQDAAANAQGSDEDSTETPTES